MTIHKEKTPTIIQKIFKEHRGLAEVISRHNSKKGDRITTLTANVVRKAVKGENVNFDTKFEIYSSLLDLKLIKVEEIDIYQLFDNK